MEPIYYINRLTGQRCEEKVFWSGALGLLYGEGMRSRLLGGPLKQLLARCPLISQFCGYWQRRQKTAKAIKPFIESYGIDPAEFAQSIESYQSFNDFFIRKLKPEARPIAAGENTAVIPADGRFYFFQDIGYDTSFTIKGQQFDLKKFLQSETLAKQYAGGSMVLGRLCPVDYHRFHFPVNGIPGKTHPIPGALYSVNPWAIKKNSTSFGTINGSIAACNPTVLEKFCWQKLVLPPSERSTRPTMPPPPTAKAMRLEARLSPFSFHQTPFSLTQICSKPVDKDSRSFV